jgi:hypothetical protein
MLLWQKLQRSGSGAFKFFQVPEWTVWQLSQEIPYSYAWPCPKGQVLAAMTDKALADLALAWLRLPKMKCPASLTALFHMGRARTMAGFAPFFVFGASGDGFFGMGRNHVGLEAVLMAAFADFRSHGAVASARLLRRQAFPEDEKNGDDGKDENDFPHHIPLLLQVK